MIAIFDFLKRHYAPKAGPTFVFFSQPAARETSET